MKMLLPLNAMPGMASMALLRFAADTMAFGIPEYLSVFQVRIKGEAVSLGDLLF